MAVWAAGYGRPSDVRDRCIFDPLPRVPLPGVGCGGLFFTSSV